MLSNNNPYTTKHQEHQIKTSCKTRKEKNNLKFDLDSTEVNNSTNYITKNVINQETLLGNNHN